jgi:cell division protein FtsX
VLTLDSDIPAVLGRGIRRGITTLLREREWGTSLGALFGVFLLVQLLLVILVGAQGIQMLLKERTDLRLEVRQGAPMQDVQEFFSVLQRQEYVQDAAYITKEQAYERARTHDPELIAFLEEFGMGNPFPDTIGTTLRSLDDYPIFRSFIERAEWQHVMNPAFLSEVTDQEKQVYELLRFANAGKALTAFVLIVVGAILLFITTELVRRRVLGRSNEVLVEKLVGSSPLAMFVPFATEACILLLLAIIISILTSIALIVVFPLLVPALKAGGALSALGSQIAPLIRSTLPAYFILEIALIPVMATVGTWLGMHHELQARMLSLHTH